MDLFGLKVTDFKAHTHTERTVPCVLLPALVLFNVISAAVCCDGAWITTVKMASRGLLCSDAICSCGVPGHLQASSE